MNFFNSLAPGIYIRNESPIPILFVLSQLSPLHWCKVDPNETVHLKCGRVYFTASVCIYSEDEEPTAIGVAARLTAITATTLLTGGVLGIGLVGGLSGITSSKGIKMDFVLADGKTMVIGSNTVQHDGGESVLQLTLSAVAS